MYTMKSAHIRQQWSDVQDRVEHRGERVVVERSGKPSIALVPIEDYYRLEDSPMSKSQTEYKTDDERTLVVKLPDGDLEIRVVNGEAWITSDLSLVVMPRAANQVRVKLGR